MSTSPHADRPEHGSVRIQTNRWCRYALLATALVATALVATPTAAEVIYDSTNFTTNGAPGYGVGATSSTDLSSIYGDQLKMTGRGKLSVFKFAVFNSASSTGNLVSATETISFYRTSDSTFLGAFSCSLGALAKGYYSVYTVNSLETFNIVLDTPNVFVTQTLSNVVGSSRMGTVFSNASNSPAVGATDPGMYISNSTTSAGFYTFTGYSSFSSGVYQVTTLPDLTWNTTNGAWNTSATNWTNAAGSTVAYTEGSLATFDRASGGAVTLSGLLNPGAVYVSASSGTYVFNSSAGNQITGPTTLSKTGNGTLVLAGPNGFSVAGKTTLSAGTLRAGDDGAFGVGTLALDGGTLASDGATARTFRNEVWIRGDATLGDSVGTGPLTFSGYVDFVGGTRRVTTNVDTVMSGLVVNGGLTKDGAASLTLSGGAQYALGTTVAAGTLLVDGRLSNSAITVNRGATLGGTGEIVSLVTVLAGGRLSPGHSPGSLTVGSLDLQAGSTTFMQIIGLGGGAGSAGTDYDSLLISDSGGLGYGGSLDLDFANLQDFVAGTVFDLFSFDGSVPRHFDSVFSTGSGRYANLVFVGVGGVWTTSAGGQRITFDESTGRLRFDASSVPEIDPAGLTSVLAFAAGALGLVDRRRAGRVGA